jgi:hypothetical protein
MPDPSLALLRTAHVKARALGKLHSVESLGGSLVAYLPLSPESLP